MHDVLEKIASSCSLSVNRMRKLNARLPNCWMEEPCTCRLALIHSVPNSAGSETNSALPGSLTWPDPFSEKTRKSYAESNQDGARFRTSLLRLISSIAPISNDFRLQDPRLHKTDTCFCRLIWLDIMRHPHAQAAWTDRYSFVRYKE